MTDEQMRERSAQKVRQVMDLMHVLNIRVEARERVSQDGFIEKLVFWIDDEKYAPTPVAEGPSGEQKENHA